MGLICITEYERPATFTDTRGNYSTTGIAQEPALEQQSFTIGAETQSSDPFAANTHMIRVKPQADCYIAIGRDPKAEPGKQFLSSADPPEIIGVRPGDRLAAILA